MCPQCGTRGHPLIICHVIVYDVARTTCKCVSTLLMAESKIALQMPSFKNVCVYYVWEKVCVCVCGFVHLVMIHMHTKCCVCLCIKSCRGCRGAMNDSSWMCKIFMCRSLSVCTKWEKPLGSAAELLCRCAASEGHCGNKLTYSSVSTCQMCWVCEHPKVL